jgi:Cu/Ag efflux pump CusA
VEKIQGLPQLVIRYDRAKLAKYGLNVSELNLPFVLPLLEELPVQFMKERKNLIW